MTQIRIDAPGRFRRWYTDRKAERHALTEYKAALRALTRLHRHRDRAPAEEYPATTPRGIERM